MAVPGQTSAPLVCQMPVGNLEGGGLGVRSGMVSRSPHSGGRALTRICPAPSPSPATCDAMRRERVRQAFVGQVEQAGDAAERDMAPVDGAREDLDERP